MVNNYCYVTTCLEQSSSSWYRRGRRGCGRDRMVVEFTSICAISAYHH